MWKGKAGQRAKIVAPVSFPLENLSLEPFLASANASPEKSGNTLERGEEEKEISASYDLSACVAHHGHAANAGHYTSIARDSNQDVASAVWRVFDDDKVRVIDRDQVQAIASQGYLFFYVRRDDASAREENGKSKEED